MDAAAALAVQNRRPRVAVRFQSRPRRPLELVEDGFDLFVGRPGPPAPTRSRPTCICARSRASRPRRPPCLDSRAEPRPPSRSCPAASRSPTRYSTAARAEPLPCGRNLRCIAAVLVEADHGRAATVRRPPGGRSRETASAAEAWVFAQRASWFRLLPMRAIWRVRSRSMARAGAVHARVRAIASRSRAEGETPAAAAFSRQAAGVRGRRPPAPAARAAARQAGGSKGGAAPLARPPCSTRRGLA